MSKIEININNVTEEIQNTTNKINNYKSNCESLYRELKKVDTCWNDPNSKVFISEINLDYSQINRNIVFLEEYLKIIRSFFDAISATVERKLFSRKLNTLKYSYECVNSCINIVNKANEYLDKNINILNYTGIPDIFTFRNKLNGMLSQFRDLRNEIYTIGYNLQTLRDDIEKTIANYKNKISRFEIKKVNSNTLKYRWSTVGFKTEYQKLNSNYNVGATNNSVKINETSNSFVSQNSKISSNNHSEFELSKKDLATNHNISHNSVLIDLDESKKTLPNDSYGRVFSNAINTNVDLKGKQFISNNNVLSNKNSNNIELNNHNLETYYNDKASTHYDDLKFNNYDFLNKEDSVGINDSSSDVNLSKYDFNYDNSISSTDNTVNVNLNNHSFDSNLSQVDSSKHSVDFNTSNYNLQHENNIETSNHSVF